MIQTPEELKAAGLEVIDLAKESLYTERPSRTRRDARKMEGLQQLADALLERPDSALQELVNAAVRLCGADSAGVSLEREDRTPEHFYEWIATAGEYTPFLGASLPQYPSACSACLARNSPQLFRAGKVFFDLLGVEAAEVKDGILLPWQADDVRGTIFIISHSSSEAFDRDDLEFMQVLATFTAMGMRQQRQQQRLIAQAMSVAAMSMANELAHQINNPLQGLTNMLFLAKQEQGVGDERSLALRMEADLHRLSVLTRRLLSLPKEMAAGG